MPRGSFLILALLMFFLFVPQGEVVATPTGSTVEVLKLEQSDQLFGPITAFVAADAVRCEMKRLQLVLICAAPKWDVCLYSVPRKLEWRTSFAHFQTQGFSSLLAGRGTKSVPDHAKIENLDMFGAKCQKFRWVNSKNKGILPSFYGVYYGKKEKFASNEFFELQTLSQKYPLQVNVTLGVLSDIPVAGVPLTTFTDSNGSYRYLLRTTSMTKQQFDKSIFAYPTGYKTTELADPLMTTASSKEDVEDSFGTLFGDKGQK